MAKSPIVEPSAPKTVKRCACGATVFQGTFQRGQIVDGVLAVRETLYQCVNCHAVKPLGEYADHVVETA